MPYFSLDQAIGNIILIALIIFILRKEYFKAFIWALLAGFCLDISLGIGIGPYFISFLVILIILYFSQEKIFSENLYVFALPTIFIASIIFDIFLILIIKLVGQEVTLGVFWTLILKQAAYNTILLAVIYPIYYYIEGKLFPQPNIKLP
jgi:rod shape-determining protein MreD